jgi:hypothetical protein
MIELAKFFSFAATSDRRGPLTKLRSVLGLCTLSGKFRGKEISICATRFPKLKNFPLRLAVQIHRMSDYVWSEESINIIARARPFLLSLHKIFDRSIVATGNALLDSRITFSTNDIGTLHAILSYEEICDQFCHVWPSKRSNGELIVSDGMLTYHEPFRLITQKTRKRIIYATNLLCDISDVLMMAAG